MGHPHARLFDYAHPPSLHRRGTLRGILAAIRVGAQVRITYQSMSHTEPTSRWVSPHALGFDGFRWHGRAWCYKNAGFVDFVLARISRSANRNPPTSTLPTTSLGRIARSRSGSRRILDPKDGRRKAVELDYGMTDGIAEITTRVCISYYLERQFGLDPESLQAKAERHQIVLVNRDELEAARSEVGDARGVSEAKAEKHED